MATAKERGIADFHAGQHMCPYQWSQEHADFLLWVEGYNEAKAAS